MKVHELIALLQEFNPDYEVNIESSGGEYAESPITYVRTHGDESTPRTAAWIPEKMVVIE